MSELLYTLCQMNSKLQPLVIFVRQWAQIFDISVVVQPSQRITNFMLTCFVVFFLQHAKMLPPTNSFVQCTNDANGLTTFWVKSADVRFESENTSSLNELLIEFFRYYSTFDFKKNAISIPQGIITKKSRDDPIQVINPLETRYNVCGIVSVYERTQFVEACKFALEALTEKNMDIVQLLDSAPDQLKNISRQSSTRNSKETPKNSRETSRESSRETPTKRSRETTIKKSDETNSVAKRDETNSVANRGQTNSVAKRGETSSVAKEGETSKWSSADSKSTTGAKELRSFLNNIVDKKNSKKIGGNGDSKQKIAQKK